MNVNSEGVKVVDNLFNIGIVPMKSTIRVAKIISNLYFIFLNKKNKKIK